MKQTYTFTGNLDVDGKLKWAILMNRKDFAKIAIETANTPGQVRWSHIFIFIVLFSVCVFDLVLVSKELIIRKMP